VRRQTFLLTSFLLALFMTARTDANESTTHRMTSGTFGVAWIASEGLVYTRSPEQAVVPFRVNNIRAHQLAAIDYDADGSDELLIIDALVKGLYIYDFDDDTMIGPYGSNVSEITVGRFEPNEEFESLIACTYTGHTYLWNINVGDQGWTEIPGDFVQAYRGKVVPRLQTDSLITVSRGDVYSLDPVWKTYSPILSGKDARVAIPCEFSAYPGEEIVVACGEDHDLFLCKQRSVESLDQQAIVMARGSLTDDSDTVFAVTPEGVISQYLPKEKAWKDFPAQQVWGDLILQDIAGDEQDELFAVPAQTPEELFQYDPETEFFVKLPHQLLDVSGQPSTVSLQTVDANLRGGESENVTLKKGDQPVIDCKFWNTTHKPYVIRMYTPNGRNVLRDSPADHIHHHGLMFAIKANNCDFWAETPGQPQGKEELSELSVDAIPTDPQASFVTATLLWKNADSAEILQELRTITAIPYDQATLISWSSELSKAKGQKVTLSGSHYFGLGMRFLTSMDDGGTFRFAEDHEESTLVRGDERVTKASWAAYTASVDGGEPATAVIFSHPDNFRPMHAFTMGDSSPSFAFLSATLNLYRESYEWESDENLHLRWGIALFDGDPSDETIEEVYGHWKSTAR
jgi:hypothetical protein